MSRQLHLDTSNLGANVHRRYSFLETPMEMHAPGQQYNEQRNNEQQFDRQQDNGDQQLDAQQYSEQQHGQHYDSPQHHTEQYNGQQYDGQQHNAQQYHGQQEIAQQYHGQQYVQQYGQQYTGPQYDAQQFNVQQYNGQQHIIPQHNSQQYNGEQYHGQQHNNQPFSPQIYSPDQIQQHTVVPIQSPSIYNEKAQHLLQNPVTSPYNAPPPEQHPANYAPYAEDTIQSTRQIEVQAPQYSYAAPPNSPGPLPIKTSPEASEQARETQAVAVAPDTNPLHSPTFPRFPPPTARSTPQLAASDDITAYHQPGQIAHPNQVIKGGTWRHSLCDCSNIWTCCLGLLCPCILYGKTQHRLSLKSKNEDPTNMLGYETCNGSCTAMALLCGCQWLLATIQHNRTRKAYGIRGDVGSDCVRATCCTCCTLIQDETEIKKREEERGKAAIATGAALVSPYTAPVQMTYGPPPR
ncbi:hypothetical protein ASPWEDRAFT_26776 [Aspergillus wentii DTO 134E9]|uniref:DUF614 domain protein n=1 Tax=Aspergillus wentii DTO 134E9 TaxID=1073089 RepID=A0A1L9RR27_ASPWE|nr:uncharacterized protein ASPWEDRAFT_26776 [Aspergillus wentii DTO 134E9]KAI9928137.1 hypothetical protein MW887_002170 [Aspergillus wentii]OJJ37384.1 hypothetical protein ASPWEDRAFT_26776 [Aspergillus wentii DTO 134E9]